MGISDAAKGLLLEIRLQCSRSNILDHSRDAGHIRNASLNAASLAVAILRLQCSLQHGIIVDTCLIKLIALLVQYLRAPRTQAFASQMTQSSFVFEGLWGSSSRYKHLLRLDVDLSKVFNMSKSRDQIETPIARPRSRLPLSPLSPWHYNFTLSTILPYMQRLANPHKGSSVSGVVE